MGIFLVGDFLGGTCPVGIIRVAICRVGAFLVPKEVEIPLPRIPRFLQIEFVGKL